MEKELQDVVETYAEKNNSGFSLDQLLEDIGSEFQDYHHEINELCSSSRKLSLIHYLNDECSDCYVGREQLFTGAQLCIKPTQLEIDNGVLVPGHRFMPFCNQNITPGNIIFQNADGEAIEHKNFSLSMHDSTIFHTLFGRLGMFGIYTFDNPDNAQAIETDGFDAMLSLPVFDMSSFYNSNAIGHEDLILVEVVNWKAGMVKVVGIKRADELKNNFAEINDWVDAFACGLTDVCSDFGVATTTELQLERIFARNQELLRDPAIHIGGALQLCKDFAIQDIGGSCVLWDVNEDPEEEVNLTDYTREPYDNSDEPLVDQIATAAGVPYSSGELEAFVRNEFFCGRSSFDAMFNNYMQFFINDLDNESIDIIRAFMQECWNENETSYNRFADNNAGVLRERLIQLKMEMVKWLVNLESKVRDINALPAKKILQFSEMMSYVTQSIAMCNNVDEVVTKDELEINIERLDELNQHAIYLMEDIAQNELNN